MRAESAARRFARGLSADPAPPPNTVPGGTLAIAFLAGDQRPIGAGFGVLAQVGGFFGGFGREQACRPGGSSRATPRSGLKVLYSPPKRTDPTSVCGGVMSLELQPCAPRRASTVELSIARLPSGSASIEVTVSVGEAVAVRGCLNHTAARGGSARRTCLAGRPSPRHGCRRALKPRPARGVVKVLSGPSISPSAFSATTR